MGTGALMSLGVRAMAASYAQLQTTSNNITNVNTKGYSRQEVQLATAGGQYTGAGFFAALRDRELDYYRLPDWEVSG